MTDVTSHGHLRILSPPSHGTIQIEANHRHARLLPIEPMQPGNGKSNVLVVVLDHVGVAADKTAMVAGLVDMLALPLCHDGRIETLEEWLGWFCDGDFAEFPAIAVHGAWVRLLTGRPGEADRLLALAENAMSTIPLSDGSADIEPWVANVRAFMMPRGVERALADAHLALEQFAPESGWRPSALVIRGVAHALLGDADHAQFDLAAAVDAALAIGAVDAALVAHAELALLAAQRRAWSEAGRRARQAEALVEATGLDHYPLSALAHVAVARVALRERRQADVREALARADRLWPLLDHSLPWLTVQVGLELARSHLALADVAAARTFLAETDKVLERRPDLGSLVEAAQEVRKRVAAASGSGGAWAMSLSGAELRLLPFLATHLTFPQIARRLFISPNTVKTEAISIYRKLDASSRAEAVDRAVEVGLLESSICLPCAKLA